MKKVLLFFPENPLKKDSGNKTRVLELLKYFKSRDFEVDFAAPRYSDFEANDAKLLEQTNLVKNCYLIHRKPGRKLGIFRYFFGFKLPSLFHPEPTIMNFVTYNFQQEFNRILSQNQYGFIIISYVGWARLIENNHFLKNAKTIIDTHDFATVQAQGDKNYNAGKFFGVEISRLGLFDEIWAISSEEFFVFSKFAKPKVRLVPFIADSHFEETTNPEWDLIYVASANIHNIKSAKWFFSEVYPLLDPSLKICVIGKVCNAIGEFVNVSKNVFVTDVNLFYATSRIAICPMLGGSGVKIKVIEALSFGLPVVCHIGGTDGLSDKTENGCLIAHDAATFAESIAKLHDNALFYSETAQKAKAFFIRNFQREMIYDKMDAAFGIKKNIL